MNHSSEWNKTLDELDPPAWREPEYDSHLVLTCHRLRRKPLKEFSSEDLRIMIGQGIGLPWLVPIALETLERNPLAEGDLYPGDLLASVLRLERGFWSSKPGWRARVDAVLDRVPEVPKELHETVTAFREHQRME